MRILLIEDDERLVESLGARLRQAGYALDVSTDGIEGLYAGEEFPVDLAIVDLGLPGLNGLEVIRRLRQRGRDFPILILTARSGWQDKVEGLEAGADDYLVKPFELLEVYARVQALWRRSLLSNRASLEVADLTLNLETLEVSRGGQPIRLKPVPLKILRLLMENSHRVVTRREIESFVWGDDLTESDSLRTHISALRTAIDKPFEHKLLHTMHGVGYRLYESR